MYLTSLAGIGSSQFSLQLQKPWTILVLIQQKKIIDHLETSRVNDTTPSFPEQWKSQKCGLSSSLPPDSGVRSRPDLEGKWRVTGYGLVAESAISPGGWGWKQSGSLGLSSLCHSEHVAHTGSVLLVFVSSSEHDSFSLSTVCQSYKML